MKTGRALATSDRPAEQWEIAGQPVPAARPRVSKWGTYYPKTYANWLKSAKESLTLTSLKKGVPSQWVTPVEVSLTFVIEKAKTSKLTVPTGDVDNYAKGALDALTHNKVWSDDKLVTRLHVEKRFALPGEAPRVLITIQQA